MIQDHDHQSPKPRLEGRTLLVDLIDWQSGEVVFAAGCVFDLEDSQQIDRLVALYNDQPREPWAIGYWLDIWSVCTSLNSTLRQRKVLGLKGASYE